MMLNWRSHLTSSRVPCDIGSELWAGSRLDLELDLNLVPVEGFWALQVINVKLKSKSENKDGLWCWDYTHGAPPQTDV